jgi:dipeptidyl aminopeptidase/acylaminoacyl peptidase
LATSGPYLAYLRSQGDQYEIVLTDADGKGQKLIPYPANATTQGGMPSLSNTLSPDGQWLAYYTGSAGKCFGNGGADTADLTLNLMSLSDGKTQVITKLLSQDYPNIFAKAAQELNLPAEMLQNAFVCGIDQSISWSPDGRYLAFAGQMDGLSSDLYVYDSVSNAIKRLSSGPEEIQMISWSPDGKWIMDWSSYSVGEGMTYNVYATTIDGAVIKKLETNVRGIMRWLNDQSYFTHNNGNGVGNSDLALVNIETGATVTVWAGQFYSFAASADHKWVVCFSQFSMKYLQTGNDPNFIPGLYLVNLTTLEQSRVEIPDNSHVYEAIQPLDSGDHLFALIDATENNLYFLSPDGKLTSAGVKATRFSISPDRKHLVAMDQKIRVLKADGTSIRDVDLPASLTSRGIWTIIWRPDSSGLFFFSDEGPQGPQNLYIMDLLTGDPVQGDVSLPTWWWWPSNFIWVAQSK